MMTGIDSSTISPLASVGCTLSSDFPGSLSSSDEDPFEESFDPSDAFLPVSLLFPSLSALSLSAFDESELPPAEPEFSTQA